MKIKSRSPVHGYPKPERSSSSKHSQIITLQANQRQIVAMWLMNIIPNQAITLNLSTKQISGSRDNVRIMNTNILDFLSKNSLRTINNRQFSHNQCIYIKKKFETHIFSKKNILDALKDIKKFMNLKNLPPSYLHIQKQTRAQGINLIIIPKESQERAFNQIKVLLLQNIEPSRQMISKKAIPNLISVSMQKKEQKQNAVIVSLQEVQSESEQELFSSDNDDEQAPTFYNSKFTQEQLSEKNKNIRPLNQKKQQVVKPTLSNREKFQQQTQYTTYRRKAYNFKQATNEQNVKLPPPKQKQIVFYAEIESIYFNIEEFKKWIRSNAYLQVGDFIFEKDYELGLDLIKFTNLGSSYEKGVKQLENYFNEKKSIDISILTRLQVRDLVKKYCMNTLKLYQCQVVHEISTGKESKVMNIKGYKPKVEQIYIEIGEILDLMQIQSIMTSYSIELGKLSEYSHHKIVKNMIIHMISQKLNEPQFQYISQIHAFNLQETNMIVQVKRKHRKLETEADNQLQKFLHKANLLHDSDLNSEEISEDLQIKYNMIPEYTQNDEPSPKLLLVCEQKYCMRTLMSLLNELDQERDFIFEKIKFNQKMAKFIEKQIRVFNNETVRIRVNQDVVEISGKKNDVRRNREHVQKAIKCCEQSIKQEKMNLSDKQFSFLNKEISKHKKNASDQVILVFQNSELLILFKDVKFLNESLSYLKDYLQKNKKIKTFHYLSNKIIDGLSKIQEINKIIIDEIEETIAIQSFDENAIYAAEQTLKLLTQNLPKLEQSEEVYPQSWEQQTTDIELLEVSHLSDQYKEIVDKFVPGTIKSLKRIQNKPAYRLYLQEKLSLTEINKSAPKTMLLYHGTSKTHPSELYLNKDQIFNVNYTGDRNYLGYGVYFAAQSKYSHNYSFKTEKGTRMMLYCEVLTGDSQQLVNKRDPSMKDTDFKDRIHGIRYQSATCFTNGSDIYAIYKSRRAYPLYLIEYTSNHRNYLF